MPPATSITISVSTPFWARPVSFRLIFRLAVAKDLAADFVKARPVDQIGLVVFSGESFTQYPLSTDHEGLLLHPTHAGPSDGGEPLMSSAVTDLDAGHPA